MPAEVSAGAVIDPVLSISLHSAGGARVSWTGCVKRGLEIGSPPRSPAEDRHPAEHWTPGAGLAIVAGTAREGAAVDEQAITPAMLEADATVPQCLDNQYVPNEVFASMSDGVWNTTTRRSAPSGARRPESSSGAR